MATPTLVPEILELISEIESPVLRRRYALFYQLPQNLQDKMLSEETSRSVWVITRDKYGLADKDITAVARVIGLVILGELSVKNFISELANKLKIDVSKASQIAQDINQLIFQSVRESLMAVHGLKASSDADTRINADDADMRIKAPTTKPAPPPVQPKPVSLQELDKRAAPPKPVQPPPPAIQPRPFDVAQDKPQPAIPSATQEKESEQRRQELIERLKKPKVEKKPTTTLQRSSGQAAWNGRTIDLTKIPPRREVNSNGKYKKNGVRYLDPRDLYES